MSDERLFQLMTGHVAAHAIFTAAELGLADLVADGRDSVPQLAEATGSDEGALRRLLRFLASNEIFREESDDRFVLTAMAELLRSDVADSKRDAARMLGRTSPGVAEMLHSVKTRENGFVKAHGKPLFEYLSENPQDAAIFDAAMTSIHGGETDAVLDAYDFGGIGALADIGGGNGSALIAALRRYPHLKGILFDLPHVVERAKQALASAGLAERCECVGGSFFESVPSGADAYILRHIIHDWYDQQAMQILRNCREAMPDNGRLLIVEAIVAEGNDPDPAKLFDMVMLTVPGGMERDREQFTKLLRRAGFELSAVVATESVVSVVEGRPAS